MKCENHNNVIVRLCLKAYNSDFLPDDVIEGSTEYDEIQLLDCDDVVELSAFLGKGNCFL